MRTTTREPELAADLKEVPSDRLSELQQWLTTEVEDALTARHATEQRWSNGLRQYNSVPKNPSRNVPIENAPNIQITLGAIGTDSIYAQVIDLIWNISPTITIRAVNAKYEQHQKAFQRWVEYVATNELDLRNQADHAVLDDVMLGTGAFYVPWVEEIKKTNVLETTWQGPRAYSIPPEDVIVPGGSTASPQDVRWIALRFWYTKAELELMKTQQDWDVDGAAIAGGISTIRSERERLAGTSSSGKRLGDLYEILVIFALYDIDHDGINEDLSIVWDRSSRKVMKLSYNSYDHRPIEKMCYQIRAHQWDGIGVMEMLANLEDGASDIFSYWICNMLLANCRMWAAPPGQIENPLIVFPNKLIELSDPNAIKELRMSDVYSSGPQAVAMIMSLAERRTGQNDMSMPRPSQVLGSRTPATTSMMLFQQVNKRFTPAFDGVRLCVAGVVIQAMYRYQEQLLAKNKYTEDHINDVMGLEEGLLVLEILKDKNFSEAIKVELTASSATLNREVERQNAMFLVGILSQYYEKVLQLITIVANPQTPKPVADVAKKIAIAAGEAIERTMLTFDQMRDPQLFIIDVEAEVDAAANGAQDQQGLQSLLAMLQGGQAPGAGQIQTPVT
jgi:hypothetical protein